MIREELIDYARRKKLTGKLILIFVITMLFLTFFSSTINNFMLPRVKLDRPTSGALIKEISGEGIVEAKSIEEQYIDTNMKVTDVMINVGDRVKKGQPIISLNTESLNSSIDDENAKYEQLKITLDRLKDSGSLVTYDNNIASALENKEQQEKNYHNAKILFDAGAESANNLKTAETSMKSAQRNYEAAIQAKAKFERDNQRDIENAQLNLDIESRKIEALKKQTASNGVYTAPADGIITELNFSKGAMANSSKPLFKLSDAQMGYQLKVAVDSTLADYVKAGEDVSVNVVSLNDKKVTGKISGITDDDQQRGKKKDIVIDINDEGLAGGERAEIFISKKTKQYAALVPNTAVYNDSNGSYVFVVKSKNSPLGTESYLQKVSVIVEDSDNSKSAVLNGIMITDKVVVQSSKPVADGDRVVVEQ